MSSVPSRTALTGRDDERSRVSRVSFGGEFHIAPSRLASIRDRMPSLGSVRDRLPLQRQMSRASGFVSTKVHTNKDLSIAIPIPPWSLQDRQPRNTIELTTGKALMRSHLLLLAVYVPFVLIILSMPTGPGVAIVEACLLLIFVVWHFAVVLAIAVPDASTSCARINARTNGSIFLAMVLYPCVGLDHGDEIQVNFGAEPFAFDLDAFEARSAREVRSALQAHLPPLVAALK